MAETEPTVSASPTTGEATEPLSAADPDALNPGPAPQQPEPARRKWFVASWWALGIAALLSLELYAYGHNGLIRVCVGRKAITDLTLLDKKRDGAISSGFPFCVEQLNLGMYSRSDDVSKSALDVACGRAATLLRGDKTECLRRDKDWIRRVDKTQIAPWDPRLYKRLFFVE